jgi:L-lactate dehydrogenase complex protein LldF
LVATTEITNETSTHGGHDHLDEPFGERYERALHNPRLAKNITRYQQNWRVSRTAAMEEVEFAELRAKLKAAKTQVVDKIDDYLAQFAAAAEQAGATVHHATDADHANRIVHEICRRHGVQKISKSKSMVSEEIELNHYLEARGITCVETDLGEWIVQKAGQRPSHIVGPALHMGRQDVGELLAKLHPEKQVPFDDIPRQVHTIRDLIRPEIFESGVGMTGGNALIAETGTVMICTNEGNGRLVSSVPPVQIALVGIEKLIPTWDDAVTQLRLLGRSGTGQRITVYTTFMTGPAPGHEMHVVLVDNGRRKMRAMPEFSEALHCIRCGACANVCPPYREVGGHVFGHIYTGAIGLVVTQFHHGLDAIAKPQSLCLSCNACEMVCPVGIPLPRQIIDVRKMVVAKKKLPLAKRVILAGYSRPRVVNVAARIGERAQLPLTRGGRFVRGRRLPILNKQTRWRSLPAFARRPLRDRVEEGAPIASFPPVVPNGAAGKSVALFPGCMTDRLFPEQGEAVATALRHLGVRLTLPRGLNCCGLPANNMGDEPTAKRMAMQTITALERTNADYIVSGSASCVAMLRDDYLHLFRDDPTWLARASRFAEKVIDFTSFMDRVANLPAGSLTGPSATITYHDSCQGANALGLRAEPRRLLQDVLGLELRELEENTLCCGFGGSFSFDYPEVAERLMNRKLDNAQKTGAPIVVTDNQGCIMHLRGGCDAGKRSLQVKHLAELVAERLEERGHARRGK